MPKLKSGQYSGCYSSIFLQSFFNISTIMSKSPSTRSLPLDQLTDMTKLSVLLVCTASMASD